MLNAGQKSEAGVRIPEWAAALDQIVSESVERLSAIRRHLHQNPEPSGEETETTTYLLELLKVHDFCIRIGPRRRGAIIEPAFPENTNRIAVRGDIDGLFIQDRKEVPYRSQRAGVMHACGHDAHAACIIGVVRTLDALATRNLLPWPVPWRAILQPSEETASGAKEMISIGALADVAAIFALHLEPGKPVGCIRVKDGAFTASCDQFEVHVTGRGGHGARPQETLDPIAASAQAITAIYQMLPRMMNPHVAVVASVGEIAAGCSPNVIPEKAVFKGTVRALSTKARTDAKEALADIIAGIAKTTRCRMETVFAYGCAGVTNDPALTDVVREARQLMPEGIELEEMETASMGGEDFAEYVQLVPGTMFRLGCQHASGCATLHSPLFDLDERALAIGVRLLTRAIILRAAPDWVTARSTLNSHG
jgi:amidohydrolase